MLPAHPCATPGNFPRGTNVELSNRAGDPETNRSIGGPSRAENRASVTVGLKGKEVDGLLRRETMNIDIKAVGWLETVEFVDISEAII